MRWFTKHIIEEQGSNENENNERENNDKLDFGYFLDGLL